MQDYLKNLICYKVILQNIISVSHWKMMIICFTDVLFCLIVR